MLIACGSGLGKLHLHADLSTNIIISSYTVFCCFSSAILEVNQVVSHQVSGPVVPYHATSDDNQSGQQQIQSVTDPSVQGKQWIIKCVP